MKILLSAKPAASETSNRVASFAENYSLVMNYLLIKSLY